MNDVSDLTSFLSSEHQLSSMALSSTGVSLVGTCVGYAGLVPLGKRMVQT
jgi:hypothetical protein